MTPTDDESARTPPKGTATARLETSAGGVVCRIQDGTPRFLLIRDSYRNWGFPKGHLEQNELPDAAALREVREETGIDDVELSGVIDTIDWFFRFRGRLVHKVCHFYLMMTRTSSTTPQRAEGITACRWATFEDATAMVSYVNAREVLTQANAMVCAERAARRSAPSASAPKPSPTNESRPEW